MSGPSADGRGAAGPAEGRVGRRFRVLPLEDVLLIVPGLVVGLLAVANGGFFPRSWAWSGAALAALAVLALSVRGRVRPGRLEVAACGAFAAVAVWTGLSALWSVDPAASLRESERALVYVIGLAAVLLVARPRGPGMLLGGLLVAILAVCVYGIGDYALGARHIDQFEGTTLFEPLGYANALALMAAIGALLAAAFVVEARRWHWRALAAGSAALAVATIALTRSRGGWLALAVGVVVAVTVGRRALRPWLPVVVVAAVAGALGLGVVGSAGGNRPAYWRAAWLE